MPKPKIKNEPLDLEISINCKALLTLNHKVAIAKKFKRSPGYINMIIRRERNASPEIAKELKRVSDKVLKAAQSEEYA